MFGDANTDQTEIQLSVGLFPTENLTTVCLNLGLPVSSNSFIATWEVLASGLTGTDIPFTAARTRVKSINLLQSRLKFWLLSRRLGFLTDLCY